jgi:hypothetical protein
VGRSMKTMRVDIAVGMALASCMACGCGKSPVRLGPASPDGSVWLEVDSGGRGRLYVDGRERPEDLGCLEGQWWVDWFGARDVVLTDIGHSLNKSDYVVREFGGVRVELRGVPTRTDMASSSGALLRIWKYEDSRGMQSAVLSQWSAKGGMDDATVIGEGPWTIEAEWLSGDVLRLIVSLGPGVVAPVVPIKVGIVGIECRYQ